MVGAILMGLIAGCDAAAGDPTGAPVLRLYVHGAG